ncbi:TetR family transcriptional regulator [Streptomyces sp. NPDC002308]
MAKDEKDEADAKDGRGAADGRTPGGRVTGGRAVRKTAAPRETGTAAVGSPADSADSAAPPAAEAGDTGEKAGRPSAKSEQTRTVILETALRLFQERGYDKTTMRAIAQEAGVSVGNAYYYFAGKEHLVQGFYDRIGAEHRAAARIVLDRETDLEARLAGVLTAWLDVATPYHEFAAQFFKNAADPDSPLSPFSAESEPARVAAIALHREVLTGSKAKVPEELADALPELMWLSQMGLVLYWVFDRTPDRERTRRLALRGARLTTRGVALARFRVLRPLVREVHELFTDFLPGMASTAVALKKG